MVSILAVGCTVDDLQPVLDVPVEVVECSAEELPRPKNLFGGYDIIALGDKKAEAAYLLCALAQGKEETVPRAIFRWADGGWYDSPERS